MSLSPDEVRAELAAQGTDPDEAVRTMEGAPSRAFAIDDVHRAYQHATAIAATGAASPAPAHADPEIERLAYLRPEEIPSELVVPNMAEAARVVEEAPQAALN